MCPENAKQPEISIVMPCFNEQECLPRTSLELLAAFARRGIVLQLVLVDNGSRDRTGAIIDELIAAGEPVTKVTVQVNAGYGNGVLQGLKACTAPWLGFLCADGQVTADDTAMICEVARAAGIARLAKVRRLFRKDSWRRKVISILYNWGMQFIFGWLSSIDINGNPKVMSRSVYEAMQLQSRDWFLDPEIMIKAKYMRVPVLECDVEGQLRQGGRSNVRSMTLVEFVKNILAYRFGSAMRRWKQSVRESHAHKGLHVPAPEDPRR